MLIDCFIYSYAFKLKIIICVQHGSTVLMKAVYLELADIVQLIIQKEAILDVQDLVC